MMKLKALLAGGLLAVSATASVAQSLDPVRVEMFRSILAGNECTLTEAAAGNILPRFDFTREETRAIVGALVAAGEVQLDGNTLMLVDGSCATEDPVVALLGQRDVQQFIAVMSEYSCAMSEADAGRIFPERGMNKEQVRAVVVPMIGANMATFNAGILNVNSAYCSPALVAEETAPVVGSPVETPAETVELDRSGMFGMGRVRELVDVMAQNGCTLNMEVADGYLAEAGIEHSFATFIAKKMISDGYASMIDAQNMQLPAPYCIAAGGAAPVAQAETPAASVSVPQISGMSDEAMKVVAVFNAVGCEIPVSNTNAVFEAAGMTLAEGMAGIQPFIVNGQVRVSDSGGEFVMDREICDPAAAVVQADASTEAPATVAPTTTPAVGAIAFENDGSPQGRFMAALIANNCVLEITGAEDYLANSADLRMDQSFRVVDDLVAAGDATLSADGVSVQIDPRYCAESSAAPMNAPVNTEAAVETPQATPAPVTPVTDGTDPRAGVLAMLAANNCEVTQANVAGLAAAAGLDLNATMRILGAMMNAGEATSPDFGQTLQVSAPLCVATAAEPMTPRDIFINLIKQNDCSITAAEFSQLLPVDGLDASTAFGMIGELEAEGVISLPATRDVVTLSAEMCR